MAHFKIHPIVMGTKIFNKRQPNVTEILFGGKLCNASDYIKKTKEIFGSPFFEALRIYLSETDTWTIWKLKKAKD
ncbi:MAG: hypothetical protein R6W88_16060 [Desulfobacterales bacterium]